MSAPEHASRWTTWRWVAGYGVTYVPYVLLTVALRDGLLPHQDRPVSGLAQLPVTAFAWTVFAFLWAARYGWIKRLPTLTVGRIYIRFPTGASIVGGVSTSVILVSALLAYTMENSSPITTGVVTRASVLVMAPILDACFRRRVRWQAVTALCMALMSILLTTRWTGESAVSASCAIPLALYVVAYALRLAVLSKVAKSDAATNWGFFVGEHLSTAVSTLLAACLWLALGRYVSGAALATLELEGTTIGWIVLAGLASELVAVFSGLLLVSPCENTFCVSVNRCASLLSVTIATLVLAGWSSKVRWPQAREAAGVAVSLLAILMLALGERRLGAASPRQMA